MLPVSFVFASVIINEIAWMGTIESANHEWIELYNTSNQEINLDGWTIIAQDNRPIIRLNGLITDFYLLERSSDETVTGIIADKLYTNALNNEGETLFLYDKNNNLMDKVECANAWFAGDNKTKQTMQRKDPALLGSSPESWENSPEPGGTPKAQNNPTLTGVTPPSALSTSEVQPPTVERPEQQPLINKEHVSGIIISELLPSPQGPDSEEEWIELANQNDFEVDVSDWQISDTLGKTKTYTIPQNTIIEPFGFLVLNRAQTKITLNNDEDGVMLMNPNGKIIKAVNYSKAPRNQSYNNFADSWQWSNVLTPGKTNKANVLPSSPSNQDFSGSPAAAKIPFQSYNLNNFDNNPATTQQLPVFLIALIIAVFSAVMIWLLKWSLKRKMDYSGMDGKQSSP